MTITNSNFEGDSVLLLRSILASKITDPISSSRSGNEKFVMTSYPDRPVRYPIITVKILNTTAVRAGMKSENMTYNITTEIRAWARNEKEKDMLSSQIINNLRLAQYDSGSGTIDKELHNFEITSAVPVDEPGENGIKSKVITTTYTIYTDGVS